MTLMPLIPWEQVHVRLQVIFPEGTPHRANSVWEIAARTIYVMLYIGAIEGSGVWLRPDQVTRMSDDQSRQIDEASRMAWRQTSMAKSKSDISGRWYAVNTRESIRDDTMRNALVENGAVIERPDLPTTSSRGRYALQGAFASLFDPGLSEIALESAAEGWRNRYLTASALMRVAIMRKGAGVGSDRLLVTFPNGETRRMAPGPSSQLSQHVVETFAIRFLQQPAVIFLSESRDKVVERDEALAKRIGLNILADKNLPDIIIADLGPDQPELYFIEVVATDGPVSEARKAALLELTNAAGFPKAQIRFVTAYIDRASSVFRKTVDALAWGSYVWFASEPEGLVRLSADKEQLLR